MSLSAMASDPSLSSPAPAPVTQSSVLGKTVVLCCKALCCRKMKLCDQIDTSHSSQCCCHHIWMNDHGRPKAVLQPFPEAEPPTQGSCSRPPGSVCRVLTRLQSREPLGSSRRAESGRGQTQWEGAWAQASQGREKIC